MRLQIFELSCFPIVKITTVLTNNNREYQFDKVKKRLCYIQLIQPIKLNKASMSEMRKFVEGC